MKVSSRPATLGLVLVLALPSVAQGPHVSKVVPLGGGGGACGDGRTRIQDVPGNTNWRHVITEPGSYYLAANVLGGSKIAGIRVDAPNVTIDFNGFSLLGTDPGVLPALTSITSSFDDVVLSGPGVIRDWTGGVSLAGARSRVEDLSIVGQDTHGVELQGPDGAVLRCVVEGNAWEGVVLRPGAAGTTLRDCKLRDNGIHQLLVESDANRIETCTVTANTGVTMPAVTIAGSMNEVSGNTVTLGQAGEAGIEVSGDGNRLGENRIRLTSTATLARGIDVTGVLNAVRGGGIVVDAPSAVGIRFDQPLGIIAVLVGLRAGSDGATGILGTSAGAIERADVFVGSASSIGVDFQVDPMNPCLTPTLSRSRIRVAGAGATGVKALASAAIIQMNGIVLEPTATGGITIDVLGSSGGHTIARNSMVMAGPNQGGILNGVGDLVHENDIVVLGDGSTGLSRVSGSFGLISDNRIRLDALNATGIFVSEFVGETLTRNVVIGDGDQYDVGEGNTSAQMLVNPGNGFVAEDVVNVQIGN